MYNELGNADLRTIFKTTNCMKPCVYRSFKLEERQSTVYGGKNEFYFSIWAATNVVFIEKEALVFPLSSLVAQIGGTLGLFLGFSFMTIWQWALNGKIACTKLNSFLKISNQK